MWDDEMQAEIRRAWDDGQDRLAPDHMRFLESAAADVAMLASDERVRTRFRDRLTRFAAQYVAFRTAREAWDAIPRTWRPGMDRPTNPLGAIWPYTYGTGWKGWKDLEPAGRGGRARSPLVLEIEKEVPMILGAYALLAVIHDKILQGSPRIDDGFLPEDLAHEIWWRFLNDVDGLGGIGGQPQYAISRRHIEGALARVRQDVESEPQHAPIGRPEDELNGQGQPSGTVTSGTGPQTTEHPNGQRHAGENAGGAARGGSGSEAELVRDAVFISYSHKDKKWLGELQDHLKPYTRRESVTIWSDDAISPGQEWFAQIKAALALAKVAVLLVSKDFLASEFIAENEFRPLLEQARTGDVHIIWVPLGACSYKETELKTLQAPIDPDKPLANMRKQDRDKTWVKICEAINEAVAR